MRPIVSSLVMLVVSSVPGVFGALQPGRHGAVRRPLGQALALLAAMIAFLPGIREAAAAESPAFSIAVCGDSISRGYNADTCTFDDQLVNGWATGDDHGTTFCSVGANGIYSHAERLECLDGSAVASFNEAISGDSVVPGIFPNCGPGCVGFAQQATRVAGDLAGAQTPRYVAVFIGHNDADTNVITQTGNTCASADEDPNNYCRATPAAFEREFRHGLDQLIQLSHSRILVLATVRISQLCNFGAMPACGPLGATCTQTQESIQAFQSLFHDCSAQRQIDTYDTLVAYNGILQSVAAEYAAIPAGGASANGAVKAADVELMFSTAPFYLQFGTGDVSCCDCLHPTKALQERIAEISWQGLQCTPASPCCADSTDALTSAECGELDTTSFYPAGFFQPDPGCGDGIVEGGEQCDDGVANGSPTSCCTASCQFAQTGTTCSSGVCDSMDHCVPAGSSTTTTTTISATTTTLFSFLYQVDRFEVTGNRPVHQVDEFDDGVLLPWLTGNFGTSSEAGGVVTLSSPGTPDWTLVHLGSPIVLERSDSFAPSAFNPFPNEGSFSGTSTWVPLLPQLPFGFYGQFFSYKTSEADGVHWNGYSAGIMNLSPETATSLGMPDSGLAFYWDKLVLVGATSDEAGSLGVQSFPISAGDVTGSILFTISYDEAAGTLTPSYSLDGGTTFLTPFAPSPSDFANAVAVADGIFPLFGDVGQWSLIADPPTVAFPTTPVQLKCISKVHKGAVGIARAEDVLAAGCLASAASGNVSNLGTPPQAQTAQACLTNDVRGRVARKIVQLQRLEASSCLATPVQMPTYAYTPSAPTAAAAIGESIGIVRDLFGPTVDPAVVPLSVDAGDAKCQAQVLKQTLKVFETLSTVAFKAGSTLLKADPLASAGTAALLQPRLLATVQAGLSDPSGKLQKMISAIAPASCVAPLAKRSIASMFPGKCATAATPVDLSTCSASAAKCRFCRSLNAFDGLAIDCDQFDDGIPDFSCD